MGDGIAGAAYVDCYWWENKGQTADQVSYDFKTLRCAANFTYYP